MPASIASTPWKGRARHILHQLLVPQAVPLFRRDIDGEAFAAAATFHRGFQARHDVAGPLQVDQRLAPARRIHHFAGIVGQGVVEAGDGLVSDLHGKSWAGFVTGRIV
jgi:hypothetical protein